MSESRSRKVLDSVRSHVLQESALQKSPRPGLVQKSDVKSIRIRATSYVRIQASSGQV